MAHAPLLLTRPDAASRRFAQAVEMRLGAGPVVISPILEIVAVGEMPSLEGYAGIVLTSENGVLRRNPDWPPGLPAYCVGARTAQAAAAAGFDARSADGALADLVDMILVDPPDGPLLHLRGQHVAGQAANSLNRAGISSDEVVVYDQVIRPLSAEAKALLEAPGPVLIPVFSPRAAQALASSLKNTAASLHIAAISPAVANALPVHSAAMMVVAERPNAEAMIDQIAALQLDLDA